MPPPRRGAARAADFSALAGARRVLLAVSGGPDSMALMLLAARWARTAPDAPALCVATVDHGLRADSAAEAERVAGWAGARGLSHAILRWEGDKPARRVQELARAARYRLLAAHARAIGAQALVTAHHAGDQAETVLLRLARGSGVAGLAGMAAVSTREGLALHRPLLDWSKAELAAVCAAENQDTLDDPSNRDPAFARSRWRALAPALTSEGLDATTLGRLARRAARADAALERAVDAAAENLRAATDDGRIRLEATALAKLPEEIALRLLGRLLRQAAGRETTLRLDRLESLAQRLRAAADAGAALTATLGGALARLDRRGRLTLGAEPPRRRGAGAAKSSR